MISALAQSSVTVIFYTGFSRSRDRKLSRITDLVYWVLRFSIRLSPVNLLPCCPQGNRVRQVCGFPVRGERH